jgi:hypothetical protein
VLEYFLVPKPPGAIHLPNSTTAARQFVSQLR